MRLIWMNAGAILRVTEPPTDDHPSTFTCQALGADSRCTVYENRPDICRRYDCRNDAYRMAAPDDDRPRCAWPVAG